MLKSMTAYGRAVLVVPCGRFVAELHSVNRKHLEISSHLPRSLARYDALIKKWVGERNFRGQITVRIHVVFSDQAQLSGILPNLMLASQLKASWDQIASHLRVESEFSLELLAREEGIIVLDDEVKNKSEVEAALQEVVDMALIQMEEMKALEGRALEDDIQRRIAALRCYLAQIVEKAPNAVKKYEAKLLQKLNETFAPLIWPDAADRIVKEICLFADKVDIAEEITRFQSHLDQLQNLAYKRNEGIGKTLDFVVQELNREINTIGAKASDAEITRLVIDAKTEIERIKEQIQNVE